ncbi:hypothetical protein O6P43_002559 [Quillaja saponaria]|uniref:Uncharacterized protein n=1 Tax=Quillaja saponaria TaxID=32244 RepID=A0AAD7QDZ1_QUISA|nr:hypothetical protein O6P43_002559 [Quillaja saponaria]
MRCEVHPSSVASIAAIEFSQSPGAGGHLFVLHWLCPCQGLLIQGMHAVNSMIIMVVIHKNNLAKTDPNMCTLMQLI